MEGLKSSILGLSALTKKVEAAHFPDSTKSSAVNLPVLEKNMEAVGTVFAVGAGRRQHGMMLEPTPTVVNHSFI